MNNWFERSFWNFIFQSIVFIEPLSSVCYLMNEANYAELLMPNCWMSGLDYLISFLQNQFQKLSRQSRNQNYDK